MMSDPLVTVLIGSWNNADTLPRAIDGIRAQTFTDWELIVVDDGSTDHTSAVAQGTGDARVRHLVLPHLGISGSLNAGLRTARAEFVAIQDADDWSLPTRLERQYETLRRRPEVAVVGCRMREVDQHGREFRPRFGADTGDVAGTLLSANPISNGSAMFRRDLALACGGYDRRYLYAMEYDLWLRLADEHEIVNLPDFLAVREMGSTNVAATKEAAQVRETLALKLATLRRRRSLRGVSGMLRPGLSLLTPPRVKRRLRALRGQRP